MRVLELNLMEQWKWKYINRPICVCKGTIVYGLSTNWLGSKQLALAVSPVDLSNTPISSKLWTQANHKSTPQTSPTSKDWLEQLPQNCCSTVSCLNGTISANTHIPYHSYSLIRLFTCVSCITVSGLWEYLGWSLPFSWAIYGLCLAYYKYICSIFAQNH